VIKGRWRDPVRALSKGEVSLLAAARSCGKVRWESDTFKWNRGRNQNKIVGRPEDREVAR